MAPVVTKTELAFEARHPLAAGARLGGERLDDRTGRNRQGKTGCARMVETAGKQKRNYKRQLHGQTVVDPPAQTIPMVPASVENVNEHHW